MKSVKRTLPARHAPILAHKDFGVLSFTVIFPKKNKRIKPLLYSALDSFTLASLAYI